MKDIFEIERKYIIKMPNVDELKEKAFKIIKIEQTYIGLNEFGFNCRVRMMDENGSKSFVLTEKKNINGIKRLENEYEISKDEYLSAVKRKLSNTEKIEKTRYCIKQNGFIYEIDIYTFWESIAVLEVELESEEISPPIPEFLEVLKEVTGDKSLTNFALSRKIPDEKELIKKVGK